MSISVLHAVFFRCFHAVVSLVSFSGSWPIPARILSFVTRYSALSIVTAETADKTPSGERPLHNSCHYTPSTDQCAGHAGSQCVARRECDPLVVTGCLHGESVLIRRFYVQM